jgi:hypothetical protein
VKKKSKLELENWQRDLERRERSLEERIGKLDMQYAEEVARLHAKHQAAIKDVIGVLERYNAYVMRTLNKPLTK